MLIPCIDIMSGSAVQLVGGAVKALDAGDPRPLARRFGLVGEVAVVDLDAAMGKGLNRSFIEELLDLSDCRVGGGIRNLESAIQWLDKGAKKIIIGTAATRELLVQLPPERTIVALDCRDGQVVVDGWQSNTGQPVEKRISELRDTTGGFLVTFVEREGRMKGIDIEAARRLKKLAGNASLTVAGGVADTDQIRELDRLGVDVQVGMAIYTGKISLADAFLAPMNPQGPAALWPTVVVDEHGTALGLAWSNRESVQAALDRAAGIYHSRERGLWVKGEISGSTQELLRIGLDCDRDALRFKVRQHGSGFCHTGQRTCWSDDHGYSRLARRIKARLEHAPDGSYTNRLFNDPALLSSKLLEEARELVEACGPEHIVQETADLMYFMLVRLAQSGATLEQVSRELDRRELRVTRRPGDAKPEGV